MHVHIFAGYLACVCQSGAQLITIYTLGLSVLTCNRTRKQLPLFLNKACNVTIIIHWALDIGRRVPSKRFRFWKLKNVSKVQGRLVRNAELCQNLFGRLARSVRLGHVASCSFVCRAGFTRTPPTCCCCWGVHMQIT